MKHFQIADLFGRRLVPDLSVTLRRHDDPNLVWPNFGINPLIVNQGSVAAKFVTCICQVIAGFRITATGAFWQRRSDGLSCQFSTGFNSVVYPEIPFDTGHIAFQPTTDAPGPQVSFRFSLYADSMHAKHFDYRYLTLQVPQVAN
jgi:hypothetical protein